MRRNDFFKYLLLGGGGSASRAELETEILPYTFISNSYKLRNYRIYGNTVNGESVGDLVTEGEHSGEYCVPVKVEGKNLWNENCYQGGIYDSNGKPNTLETRVRTDYITITKNQTYTLTMYDTGLLIKGIYFYDADKSYINSRAAYLAQLSFATLDNNDYKYMVIVFQSDNGTDNISPSNITKFMINIGSAPSPYEPYQPPVTTPIYLPEQIRKVGDEAEYIDFRKQKQHFADGTSADVTLPAIPILFNTNTLSVGTTVQPSKIWIQGNISEIETVSVQALQANMQSLQPLSIDDENLELDVKPIEKPVLNLNDVSEIENAEIERGVESAE